MNLIEITELINAIPKDDIEMIDYYTNKRLGLVDEINKVIISLGQDAMTLEQMLLLSSMPDLTNSL